LLGSTGVGIVGFSTLVILLPMRGLGFVGKNEGGGGGGTHRHKQTCARTPTCMSQPKKVLIQ